MPIREVPLRLDQSGNGQCQALLMGLYCPFPAPYAYALDLYVCMQIAFCRERGRAVPGSFDHPHGEYAIDMPLREMGEQCSRPEGVSPEL